MLKLSQIALLIALMAMPGVGWAQNEGKTNWTKQLV